MADDLLCEYLIANGMDRVAEAFCAASKRVGFWYS